MEEAMMEKTYSGFCKALNETRTVFCEFEEKDGKRIFSGADCAYGACPHSKTCLLMKQMEEEL